MKCSIIKRKDGQLWQLHSDEYDTIGDARVILLSLASELNGEWWSYDNDELMYDVYTFKIVKSSSIHHDHSYGANDYITIK